MSLQCLVCCYQRIEWVVELNLCPSAKGGQYDLPVQGGTEQLWWIVGYGAVPLGDVCASDDKHTAGARDPGGGQTAFYRLLQQLRPPAKGRRRGNSRTLGNCPHLGQR